MESNQSPTLETSNPSFSELKTSIVSNETSADQSSQIGKSNFSYLDELSFLSRKPMTKLEQLERQTFTSKGFDEASEEGKLKIQQKMAILIASSEQISTEKHSDTRESSKIVQTVLSKPESEKKEQAGSEIPEEDAEEDKSEDLKELVFKFDD